MRLYLIRHGESQNSTGPFLQNPDEPLTEAGVHEAELLARHLAGVKIDRVVSGPWLRTTQTAERIASRFNVPVEVSDNFRGMRRPTEQMSFKKDDVRTYEIDAIIKNNFHESDWRYGDGDTFEDIKARVLLGLSELESEPVDGVALVSHSVIMRYLIGCMLFGQSLTSYEMENILMGTRVHTPGIVIAEYQEIPISKDVWSSKSKTGWVLVSMGPVPER